MSKSKIRVYVVDDHQLMIDGLKSLIEDEESLDFVGGANSFSEALEVLHLEKVDVVLMDINMPGCSGIDATRKLKALYPDIRILALTMHNDITTITQMIESGASGYILKNARMNDVIKAIEKVFKNERFLGSDTLKIVMDNISSPPDNLETKKGGEMILSGRELEILNLVAMEMTNDEIAARLFISARTVETHKRNMQTKTKTKSLVGLIKYAIENNLLEC